ncbi:hypothetical protein ACLOJK_026439 [Asimina triloba]
MSSLLMYIVCYPVERKGEVTGRQIPLFQRVKVYHLNDEGKWDDRGTGHVNVDYLEVWFFHKKLSLCCELQCHKNASLRFRKEDMVTIHRSEDLGLFVLDEEDNDTLLIHRISSDDIYRRQEDLENGSRPTSENIETSGTSHANDETFHSINSELREFPSVELSTLPLILKVLMVL